MRELRIAALGLSRRPGFTLGVVLTLGLGIGAATTVFAVVDSVLLRPLPYEGASTLVTVGSYSREGGMVAPDVFDLGPLTTSQYQSLRERAGSFESLAAVDTERLLRPSAGLGDRVITHAISSQLLGMLGAGSTAAGRSFLPEEYNLDRSVVMITREAWKRRFGEDPAVIGRPLGEPGSPILIGVLPEGFRPLEAFTGTGDAPDFYYASGADRAGADQGWEPIYVVGRLRPGVTIAQARDEVERLALEPAGGVRVGLNGLEAQTVGTSGRQLGLFLGAAALLLLLAALNGATLMLARALDRTRELAVRMALGASRASVVRLLANEAALLALLGGAVGVLLAYAGVEAFRWSAPPTITRMGEVAIDGRVLAVAALVSLVAGIAVGILPALRLAARAPWTRMQSAGRAVTEGALLRSALVAGQMAVAIVLLSGAGLLFNSFMRMRSRDPGFEAQGLITVMVPYKDASAVAGLTNGQAWDLVLARFAAIPGVASVAGTTAVPFQRPFVRLDTEAPGGASGEPTRVATYGITPGYLATMGTTLLAGRDFARGDGPEAERVALVNETFARRQMGGADVVGGTFRVVGEDGPIRVVGVIEDVVQLRAEEAMQPAIYLPQAQFSPMAGVQAVIRTTLPTEVVAGDVRRVAVDLTGVDDVTPITLRSLMAETRASPRFQAVLVGAFALVSLLLAAVGLYGSLTHWVGRRRRELGVRMALGADRLGVLGLVVGQGMRIAAVGLAVGLVATLALSRLIAGYLFEVRPDDPTTLLAVGAVLVFVSGAACLGPARRATAVDPLSVLKEE